MHLGSIQYRVLSDMARGGRTPAFIRNRRHSADFCNGIGQSHFRDKPKDLMALFSLVMRENSVDKDTRHHKAPRVSIRVPGAVLLSLSRSKCQGKLQASDEHRRRRQALVNVGDQSRGGDDLKLNSHNERIDISGVLFPYFYLELSLVLLFPSPRTYS